ncbi:MAG: DUF1559 domain-containing protein, partial [Planctomyces sp.]
LTLGFAVALLIAAFFFPATRNVREAGRRTQCRNNLKQIALALHNYHDFYGSFPPAFTVDEAGQPLHSWRTLILPFTENAELYKTIDLSKPWNDPVNRKAFNTAVAAYRCPSAQIENNQTNYLGVSGEHSFFFQNQSRQLTDIKDGSSNTLMIVDAPPDLAIPWMMPQDADLAAIQKIRASKTLAHSGVFQGTLCDGSVRSISIQTEHATLNALVTIDGGETVGEF